MRPNQITNYTCGPDDRWLRSVTDSSNFRNPCAVHVHVLGKSHWVLPKLRTTLAQTPGGWLCNIWDLYPALINGMRNDQPLKSSQAQLDQQSGESGI